MKSPLPKPTATFTEVKVQLRQKNTHTIEGVPKRLIDKTYLQTGLYRTRCGKEMEQERIVGDGVVPTCRSCAKHQGTVLYEHILRAEFIRRMVKQSGQEEHLGAIFDAICATSQGRKVNEEFSEAISELER